MKQLRLIKTVGMVFGVTLLFASPITGAPFLYVITNGTVNLGSYTGPGGAVAVPDTIEGSPVTSLNRTFYNCANVTNVTLPNTVTNIGEMAFCLCTNLTQVSMSNGVINIGTSAFTSCSKLGAVKIPDTVTNLGDYVFEGCGALTNITIPANVAGIGRRCFTGCPSLTNISVDPGNPNYTSIHGTLFSRSLKSLVHCPVGSESSYIIPAGVANIAQGAFDQCTNLVEVTFPSSVTYIGYDVFSYCSHLTNIYFCGDAPAAEFTAFFNTLNLPTTGFYLPGTTGWNAYLATLPMALWHRPTPVILNKGVGLDLLNTQFGFTVSWATNLPVVIEDCTNLSNPIWLPVQTNSLINGTNYFADANWLSRPNHFYRVRAP